VLPHLRELPQAAPASLDEAARDALRALGLDEIYSYSFVSPGLLDAFGLPHPVEVANPLREEQSAMRPRLVPGLVLAFSRNLARGESELQLFEHGQVFLAPSGPNGLPTERCHVAGLLAGHTAGWLKSGPPIDFHDASGVVTSLLDALGLAAHFAPSSESWLHPGSQADVLVGELRVGVVGELHPDLGRTLAADARLFVFEVDLDALPPPPRLRSRPLERFPSVSRDLSFFVDAQLPAGEIARVLRELTDPLCVDVQVREDYREPGRVPAGKKGMLWSFTYRSADRTLTDAEVQEAHGALLERLQKRLVVEPR
jgi:phenylalanyl-tRNA synthetase beta chain